LCIGITGLLFLLLFLLLLLLLLLLLRWFMASDTRASEECVPSQSLPSDADT